jgi:hypothetical protein
MPPAIGACDNRRVFGPNRKELPVRLLIGAGALAILLLLLACGDSGEGGSLDVTMTEFEITVEPESVPEGPIEFTIQNDGEETHDLLVVQTDIAPDELAMTDRLTRMRRTSTSRKRSTTSRTAIRRDGHTTWTPGTTC